MDPTRVTVHLGGRINTAKKVHQFNDPALQITWIIGYWNSDVKIKLFISYFYPLLTFTWTLCCFYFSDINECDMLLPCQNNGTCLNNNGSYACTCKEGWQGYNCEDGTVFVSTYQCCFKSKIWSILKMILKKYINNTSY